MYDVDVFRSSGLVPDSDVSSFGVQFFNSQQVWHPHRKHIEIWESDRGTEMHYRASECQDLGHLTCIFGSNPCIVCQRLNGLVLITWDGKLAEW